MPAIRKQGIGRGARRRTTRSRGAVAVQVAVMSTVLLGFAALAFDVGAMYNTRADLQRTADAAALAAASMLAEFDAGDPMQLARDEAVAYVTRNPVFGRTLQLASDDVEFGRAVYNAATSSYDFSPTVSFPDAVRVRVRMTGDSPNGAMPLYFARVFGKNTTEVEAEAIAMMVPRDIAVVADLSGSHTDDSELMHLDITQINLFDVWAALPIEKGNAGVGNGLDPPPPGNPNNENDQPGTGPGSPANAGGNPNPGAEPFGDDVPHGPRWGWMTGYGSEIVYDEDTETNLYDPTTDLGLYYIPKGQTCTNSDVIENLIQSGYTAQERNALLSGSNDSNSTYYVNRVKVLAGLGGWRSKMKLGGERDSKYNGGPGNGNTKVDTNELFQEVSYPFASGSWADYVNYVRGTSEMTGTDSRLRYRYGIKTVANFLLENKPTHAQTAELADCPTQPMQAVKDAVTQLVSTVETLETDDKMSLEIYGTTARHEVNLTDNYDEVADRLNSMQGGYYDTWTNMGGGIGKAIDELSSARARATSRKVMILLTDGRANVLADGTVGDYVNGPIYARQMAQQAASQGIMIFTVSVGADADIELMEELAQMGGGVHFHAAGSIDQYSAQLEQIFVRLGGTRPVELIR